MTLICVMCGAHVLLYFVPPVNNQLANQNFSCEDIRICKAKEMDQKQVYTSNFSHICVQQLYLRTLLFQNYSRTSQEYTTVSNCSWSVQNRVMGDSFGTQNLSDHDCSILSHFELWNSCKNGNLTQFNIKCETQSRNLDFLYTTVTFWSFVILMALGSIGYNVANSISDAVCFDVLGKFLEQAPES